MNAATRILSTHVKVTLGGESMIVPRAEAMTAANDLHAKHGGVPTFEDVPDTSLESTLPAWAVATVDPIVKPAPAFSEFGAGKQVLDDSAKARIEGLHAKLITGGVAVDAKEQLFETGTRMMREGYATQANRKAEHDQKPTLAQAAQQLRATVIAEDRVDVEVSAREFANAIHVNGKVTAFGLGLSERSIRGLTSRLRSPAFAYLMGLRERISLEVAKQENERDHEAIRGDKAKIAEVLRHECLRGGDVALKMRTRKGPGDIFAIVSPSFTPADAPAVLDDIMRDMPADARGSWSYDSASTAWELRAEVWTPTPVEEQAVGEPFEGYVSFQARDNGTSRFRGGGGISLLRCLNASVYTADGSTVSRVHRGEILTDIGAMLKQAQSAIHTLCEAWGIARTQSLDVPSGLTIEDAIPGFWRYLLTDRRSELVGVLPGRSEAHVEGLTSAFNRERRDHSQLVRADLAQGWTRYIQDQPTPVRRDAETAIGGWVVSERRVGCVTA